MKVVSNLLKVIYCASIVAVPIIAASLLMIQGIVTGAESEWLLRAIIFAGLFTAIMQVLFYRYLPNKIGTLLLMLVSGYVVPPLVGYFVFGEFDWAKSLGLMGLNYMLGLLIPYLFVILVYSDKSIKVNGLGWWSRFLLQFIFIIPLVITIWILGDNYLTPSLAGYDGLRLGIEVGAFAIAILQASVAHIIVLRQEVV